MNKWLKKHFSLLFIYVLITFMHQNAIQYNKKYFCFTNAMQVSSNLLFKRFIVFPDQVYLALMLNPI